MLQVDNLKLIIVAGEAKTGPPLGPVLAPYYINLVQFCKEFNLISQIYENGIDVCVKVQVDKNKVYKMLLGYPQVSLLLNSFLEEDLYLNYVSVFFFKLFLRRKMVYNQSSVSFIRMLFGFFSTFNCLWRFTYKKSFFQYKFVDRKLK